MPREATVADESAVEITGNIFVLQEASIHPVGMDAPQLPQLMSGQDQRTDHALGFYPVHCNEDVHSSQWEMHPSSDELVGLLSGQMRLFLENAQGCQPISLNPMTAVVVPAGTWHRFEMVHPGVLFTLTRRQGTQRREVRHG